MENFFDAFISYGRADSKAFATKLYEQLTSQGFNIWFDQNDIPLAVDFQEQINDGIEKAHNFLFIIAPHSVNSEYCLKEINLAVEYNKRIIPLLHVEQITQEIWQQRNPNKSENDWQEYKSKGLHLTYGNPNMHDIICKVNSVPFGEKEDNFDTALTSLVETIYKHKDYVEQHTDYLIQGLEWSRNQQQTNYLLVRGEKQKATDWLLKRFDEPPPCIPTDLHCEFISESIKNANNLMTDVFLAYSDKDEGIKEKIRRSLMRENLTVWTNKTDIKTGITFQEAINKGVEGADNFVYLISPDSLESEYCKKELAHAFTNNKRIIPLLIEETDPDLIPSQVKKLQFIDFTKHREEESIGQLLKELKQDSHYYENHKTLLVKALKWQRQKKNPSLLLRGYNLQHFEAWLKVAQTRNEHPSIPLQEEFITTSLKQPEKASLEVFISYSRTDSDLARKLNNNLQELGKTTWFDQESIPPGEIFEQEIERGIESSDNFLFIISPKSINSPYCADEVKYAQRLNKRFVTILHRPLSDEDKQNLHPTLASVQWLDFNQHGGEFAANFNELIRTLDTDRDHVRSHTEWSQQALKWDKRGKDQDLLLRGRELESAENWLSEAQDNHKQPFATDLQKHFIKASQELRERIEQKKIAQEKEKEARQKRDIRNTRLIALGSTLAFVVSSILAVIAWKKTREAEISQSRSMARSAQLLFNNGDYFEALMESLRAGISIHKLNVTPSRQIINPLQQAVFGVREKNTLAKHSSYIWQVSFSADGKTLASSSGDGTIKLWDVATGKEKQTLEGHQQGVLDISFSPDRKRLASSSLDGKIKFWDLTTGETTQTLSQESNAVWSVSFSPDGTTLASGSWDGTIKLWNLETEAEPRILTGHSNGINSVSFSPDGTTLASSSWDGTIKIWDLETDKEPLTLIGHPYLDNSVSFSPDSKMLAFGSADNTIKLWNLETGEEKQTLIGHRDVVGSVSFSPDGKTLASGSYDSTIKLWNTDQGKELDTLLGHAESNAVNSVSFRSDGKTLASGSQDGTIKLWDVQRFRELSKLSGHQNSVFSVNFSPNGKMLASGSADNTVKLWDVGTGRELLPSLNEHSNSVWSVSFSPDGKMLALGSQDGTIKLWNLETMEEHYTFKGHSDSINSVSFSPDGRMLASGGRDEIIKLWNLETMKEEPHALKSHGSVFYTVSFSPDGKMLASGSSDKTIKLWNVATGENILTLAGHKDFIRSVSFSPDGKTLVSGSDDKTIKLWDLATGKKRRTFKGHSDGIHSVSFSPDGKTLASGSYDKTIKLWNVLKGTELVTLTGHTDEVFAISFSPDGQTLVSGGRDLKVILWNLSLWDVSFEDLLKRGCTHISGYLSNPDTDLSDEERKLCDGIGEN